MKKLVLLFIVLLGVSCEKNDNGNQYYTPEHLNVLHILCDNKWRCDNHGYEFACLNYQPFDVISEDGITYNFDGAIRHYVVNGTHVYNDYAYFKLSSESSMYGYTICNYSEDSNILNEILQTKPQFMLNTIGLREFEIYPANDWGGYNLKLGYFTYKNY